MLHNFLIFYIPNFYPAHAHDYQISFLKAASPIMAGIVRLHHDLFFVLTIILIFVLYVLYECIEQFNHKVHVDYETKYKKKKNIPIITHEPVLEVVWTVIPAIILLFIVAPSFSLLYSIDEIIEPFLTIKIIGHQ